MANGERFEQMRERLDFLWMKVRRIEESDPQDSETKAVRRCSYCREPRHYRPTCRVYAADLEELQNGYNQLVADNEALRAELVSSHENRQWLVDKAFKQQDEIQELRRQLSSMGISARSTR
jgi:hypothetical protein